MYHLPGLDDHLETEPWPGAGGTNQAALGQLADTEIVSVQRDELLRLVEELPENEVAVLDEQRQGLAEIECCVNCFHQGGFLCGQQVADLMA
jgi:hypothetical protein